MQHEPDMQHDPVERARREAFLAAIEEFAAWGGGEPPPLVDLEGLSPRRSRRVSLAQVCRLVSNCADILPEHPVALLQVAGIGLAGSRTYAAAARAMLHRLKGSGGVNAARDAELERLYDCRDRHYKHLLDALSLQEIGKPASDLDRVEKAQVSAAAGYAIAVAFHCFGNSPARLGPVAREAAKFANLELEIGAIEGVAVDHEVV
jgi:hypothetical protein